MASGSLLAEVTRAVGMQVMFPVGLPSSYHTPLKKGFVIASQSDEGVQRWVVQIEGGTRDTMSEWPLLWGISKHTEFQRGGPSPTLARSESEK